jgi:hypothetical protein
LNEIEYLLWRRTLADGEVTTIYAVRYPRRSTRVRVIHFPRPQRLDVWGRRNRVEEAVVAGFFLRDPYRPLGELWTAGRPARHEPTTAPYAERRGSVVVDDDGVRLVERRAAPAQPVGDLVQAGPLLVAGGTIVFDAADDREGFSAGAGQFDSDITAGRYPRAALGLSRESLIALACDAADRTSTEGSRCSSSPRRWSTWAPRARSTSTAAAPPSSTAGTCSTAPTRRRTSLRPRRGRS